MYICSPTMYAIRFSLLKNVVRTNLKGRRPANFLFTLTRVTMPFRMSINDKVYIDTTN
jgi:hypothetical protein